MEDKSANNAIGGKSRVGRVMAVPALKGAYILVPGTSECGTHCSQEVFADVIKSTDVEMGRFAWIFWVGPR